MWQPYAYDANESTRRLIEDEMSTGLTNTHTDRGFSDLYHAFARKFQQITFSVMHYFKKVTLHYHIMLHRFEIFLPWNYRVRLY